ncbi:uncharacterized protein LOC134957927 isoform X2 [Pseudophryne corroboree]|uniref:uncharacterized protein LOC134957927 isoform X2 n=1 Tax=Pseudophryne corroboree TaxID=495146 RepID=UPI0030820A4A
MKIQIMVFTTILFYVWTLNTDREEELVDPSDMLNYDAATQTMRAIWKPDHDEEVNYDAEVIFTSQALNEIFKLLNDEDWDSTILEHHLQIILFNFKNHKDNNIFSMDFYVLMVAIFVLILCGCLVPLVNCFEDFILENKEPPPAVEDYRCEAEEGEPEVGQDLTDEDIGNAGQYPIQQNPSDSSGSYGQQTLSANPTSLSSNLPEDEIGTPDPQTNQTPPIDFIPENKEPPPAVEDYRCEAEEGEPEVGQDLTDEDIGNAGQYPIQQNPSDSSGSYGQQTLSTNATSLPSNFPEAEIGTPDPQTNQTPPINLSHTELQVRTISAAEEPMDENLCPMALQSISHGQLESEVEHSRVSTLFLIEDIYTEFSLDNENSSEI